MLAQLLEQVGQIRETQLGLKSTVHHLCADLEAVKSLNSHLYRQMESDLRELRGEAELSDPAAAVLLTPQLTEPECCETASDAAPGETAE